MIRAALIGAGGIAHNHAKGLAMMDNVKITSIIDTDIEKADIMAKEYDAKAYSKIENCIDKVDAVWIFTPPSFHKDIALIAMEKGKHILCEKPISITLQDAQAMHECAVKNNVIFMTGFNMRFRYSYQKIKEIVESGKIGKVINFWSHRIGLGAGSKGGWTGYNWRTDKNLMCGMTIESLSHDIDMMRWLVGDITQVSATINESIKELPGFDDNANIAMSLKNGGIANIFASWSSHITRNSRGVIGTKGTVIIEGSGIWNVDKIRLLTNEMTNEMVEIVENDTLDYKSYYLENLHFVDCIEKNKKTSITSYDGLEALKISNAILESAREKKFITL